MHYKDIKFPWYQNGIKTIKPSGLISLQQFVNAVISPKPEMIEAFKLIEKASKAGNKAEKDRLKTEKLFFSTPSVIVDPIRNYESIREFTNLCILEYDGVEYAEELRDYIFEKHPSCIFAFVSPSVSGTKYIFYIEKPTSVEDYKQLFFGLAADLDKFRGLDLSNERCTQPLFNSYDPNAKFREDAVPSTRRGYKTNAFDADKEIDFDFPQEVDEKVESKVMERIAFLVDRIEDNAHPQLLGISFLVGGWAAANYIHQEFAYDTLIEGIENNSYMSKNKEGYKTTARTMFAKGLLHPAEFK